jgi:MoaA/NifB/PqqE/SkfB family radical SAM enzyme/GT2 family glycosyltransferase
MLSIIINTNNRIKELDICLEFISKQTFVDYEIIIIDQNENLPGIGDIVKKYSKIIYKRFNKNLGPAVGRNFASKLAKHDLLLFLDDDAYLKNKFTLEKTVKFFLKNNYGQLGLQSYVNLENSSLHISQCIIDDDGFLNIKKSKDPNLNSSNERLSIETSFCMMKKEVFFESKGFDPIYFFYDEDTDLSLRVQKMGFKNFVFKEVKYQHESGSSFRSANSRYFNKSYLVLKNLGLYLFIKNLIKNLFSLILSFSIPRFRDNYTKLLIQFNLLINYKKIQTRKKINFLSDENYEKDLDINSNKEIRHYLNSLEERDKNFSKNNNKTAFVYITNRCNAKCEHCFYWEELNKNVDEMSLDDYKNLSLNLKNEINQVIITGGEPFLRKEIDQISKLFLNNKYIHSLNFITNGVMPERIEEKVLKIMSYASRNTRVLVNVSIDGLNELHDKIRRVPGIFQKCLDTISRLKKIKTKYQNLQISALTTLSKDNFFQFKEINQFVENELKIYQRINIIRSPKTGAFGLSKYVAETGFNPDWVKPFDLLELNSSEHKEVLDYFMDKSNWRDYHKFVLYYSYYIKKNKKKFFDCSAPEDNLVIYPNGDLAFCEYTKSFTNVKNAKNFNEFFRNQEAEKFRKLLKQCSCDHPCNIGGNLAKNKQLENILPVYKPSSLTN